MSPTPSVVIHPQIMMEPPPCLTVCWTVLGSRASTSRTQHQERPSVLKQSIFVSSDHRTRVQSATVQSLYLRANSRRKAAFFGESLGFFSLTEASKPTILKAQRTVTFETTMASSARSSTFAWTAVSSPPTVTARTKNLLSRPVNVGDRPVFWWL